MKVEVYHVDEPLTDADLAAGKRWEFMFLPWTPQHPLKKVDEFDVTNEQVRAWVAPNDDSGMIFGDHEVCEYVYRIHNAMDGTERNVKLRVRSLSVGDVVKLDGHAYAVEMAGFKAINAEEMNVVR